MLTRSDRFEHELGKLVQQRIEAMKEDLAYGALENHAQYKEKCGQIAGLRMLRELIEEAQAICDGKES
jgi:hypothetical protein